MYIVSCTLSLKQRVFSFFILFHLLGQSEEDHAGITPRYIQSLMIPLMQRVGNDLGMCNDLDTCVLFTFICGLIVLVHC